MQAILTVVSGVNTVDVGDAPDLCDPLVKAGLIESWGIATTVQAIELILKPNTTHEQRQALIKLIEGMGFETEEK
jgi:hypothetical protein